MEAQGLVHLGEVSVKEVFPYVGKSLPPRTYTVGGKSYSLRLTSLRYEVLRNSQSCAACGIVGAVLLLDRNPQDKSPHFNLYHQKTDGSLILMTKDHILPKSLGGKDHINNMRTMCMPCNVWRANDASLTLEDIRQRNGRKKLEKLSLDELGKVAFLHEDEMIRSAATKAYWNLLRRLSLLAP